MGCVAKATGHMIRGLELPAPPSDLGEESIAKG